MSEADSTAQPLHDARPPGVNAAVVLEDGQVFWGRGAGAEGVAIAEICFNTSLTGYQEILTDPSYAGQIVTFTFPHIGNVGVNDEDVETDTPAVRGCILRADITEPANWRAAGHLDGWLKKHQLVCVTGIDTRRLTRHIRDNGAPRGTLIHLPGADEDIDIKALQAMALAWPGLKGMDLAKEVSCTQTTSWDQAAWAIESGYATQGAPQYHVVAVDFGAKKNILRCLAAAGCKVTVVPGNTTAEEILGHKPDGVFLANGPAILVNQSLGKFEAQAPAPPFLRIHRSLIVNMDRIREIETIDRDTTHLRLEGCAEPFAVGRASAARIRKLYPGLPRRGPTSPADRGRL